MVSFEKVNLFTLQSYVEKTIDLLIIIFHKRASYLDPGFGDLRKFLAECKISEKKMHDNKKKNLTI